MTEITAREGYPDDDDLAQALLLAEACLESGQLDVADLMRRFWEWGELSGAGMGGLTRRVLGLYGGMKTSRSPHACAARRCMPTPFSNAPGRPSAPPERN